MDRFRAENRMGSEPQADHVEGVRMSGPERRDPGPGSGMSEGACEACAANRPGLQGVRGRRRDPGPGSGRRPFVLGSSLGTRFPGAHPEAERVGHGGWHRGQAGGGGREGGGRLRCSAPTLLPHKCGLGFGAGTDGSLEGGGPHRRGRPVLGSSGRHRHYSPADASRPMRG